MITLFNISSLFKIIANYPTIHQIPQRDKLFLKNIWGKKAVTSLRSIIIRQICNTQIMVAIKTHHVQILKFKVIAYILTAVSTLIQCEASCHNGIWGFSKRTFNFWRNPNKNSQLCNRLDSAYNFQVV